MSCICDDTVLTLHHAPIHNESSRTRTCNLYPAKVALYQLSYTCVERTNPLATI
jgi:hypothetical protein